MEGRKLQILKFEELAWRVKSRALWIKCSDSNTLFFHRFANQRRIYNTIWALENEQGHIINSQKDLTKANSLHFKNVFSDPGLPRLETELKVLPLFPRFFSSNDNLMLGRIITLKEIEGILEDCAKEKNMGPDGWTVEFYLGFWDIVGPNVLTMVLESRRLGRISGALNSTFIALIPKKSKPLSFDDFQPISLCNLIYKTISKLIVEHLKPFLASVIIGKQFGFLPNRQILDAVGVT